MIEARTTQAVVTVGGGRGFIVEGSYEQRYIITAAHCLPDLPEAFPGEQATYRDLAGPLVECVFVDPVADLAVLAAPDGQVFFEEAEMYEALTSRCTPFIDPARALLADAQGGPCGLA